MAIYETCLHPASGGFGEWDWTESTKSEATDLEDWLQMAADADNLEPTDELDGKIHNQNTSRGYGRVFKQVFDKGTEREMTTYYMVWEVDEPAPTHPPMIHLGILREEIRNTRGYTEHVYHTENGLTLTCPGYPDLGGHDYCDAHEQYENDVFTADAGNGRYIGLCPRAIASGVTDITPHVYAYTDESGEIF